MHACMPSAETHRNWRERWAVLSLYFIYIIIIVFRCHLPVLALYVAQFGCVCLSQRDAVCMHCCPVCRSPFAVVIAMTSRKWPSSKNVTNYKYVLSFQSSQLMFVYKVEQANCFITLPIRFVGHHIPYTTYTDILSIIHSFYFYCLFDYVSNKIVFWFRAEFFFSLLNLFKHFHPCRFKLVHWITIVFKSKQQQIQMQSIGRKEIVIKKAKQMRKKGTKSS